MENLIHLIEKVPDTVYIDSGQINLKQINRKITDELKKQNIQNKEETEDTQNKEETENTQNKQETEDTQNKEETENTQNNEETEDTQNKEETESTQNKETENTQNNEQAETMNLKVLVNNLETELKTIVNPLEKVGDYLTLLMEILKNAEQTNTRQTEIEIIPAIVGTGPIRETVSGDNIWRCDMIGNQPVHWLLSNKNRMYEIQCNSLLELVKLLYNHTKSISSLTSLNVVNCKPQFPVYEMTHQKRGICMIINNEHYESMKQRTGSSVDVERLKETFEKLFFDVDVHTDLSDLDMKSVLKVMSERDHSESDAFVCCILAHGSEGSVYGVNGERVTLPKITSYFRFCESLRGKPKLFFIQACQGNEYQEACQGNEHQQGTAVSDVTLEVKTATYFIAEGCDFYIVCSSEPGFVSFRDENRGSIFIKFLCANLLKYKHDSIHDTITKVFHEVSKEDIRFRGNTYKQVSWETSTLTKKIILQPVYTKPE